MNSFFDFSVLSNKNEPYPLSQHKGKVILIVNVASKCGYTNQYKGLEELYKKYVEKGLMILGFPCNQFGAQEPGTDEEIQTFCKLTYDVTFPILAKVDVNGEKADPLYKFLKVQAPGILGSESIKWNFTKFLVSKDGKVLDRYAPQTEPKDLEADILKYLNS
ncbi:MAG: glutathione peroxidase [Deltaproteobacteria bacterium]|jgi:glutathione peroxidase|nr:glutathione peroxidase [Deltaproteobacteria bacterium]